MKKIENEKIIKEIKEVLLRNGVQFDGYEIQIASNSENEPYIEALEITKSQLYNPNYKPKELCLCGHDYHRHFDPFEDDYPIGCKYCQCYEYVPNKENLHYDIIVKKGLVENQEDGWYGFEAYINIIDNETILKKLEVTLYSKGEKVEYNLKEVLDSNPYEKTINYFIEEVEDAPEFVQKAKEDLIKYLEKFSVRPIISEGTREYVAGYQGGKYKNIQSINYDGSIHFGEYDLYHGDEQQFLVIQNGNIELTSTLEKCLEYIAEKIKN